MRVRGLKRFEPGSQNRLGEVAPYAGAWIETAIFLAKNDITLSHPMRVRGLKLLVAFQHQPSVQSHPMRVRGLKRA